MFNFIQSQPQILRLLFFVGFFLLFAYLEYRFPRRELSLSKVKRWTNNLSLTLLNTLLLRLVFPLGAFGFALLCQQWQIGLFNLWAAPFWFALLASLLFLDAVIWCQHWLFHASSFFWRFHQVHHSDLNLDLSSAARFHAIEILFSMLIKCTAIAFIGAPAVAVLLFEILLSSFALFSHSNFMLNYQLDGLLRKLLVTPDMHRIHHSVLYQENSKNFGFCLSVWDKLFSTYCHAPKAGQLGMQLGLKEFRSEKDTLHLDVLLLLPFKRQNKQSASIKKLKNE